MTSFVRRRLGISSPSMKSHAAQTTSSLVNTRLATSIPGVAKNLYSSWESEIIFALVLSFFSANVPHMEFRHSLVRLCLAALGFTASLTRRAPSLTWKLAM